MPAGLTVEISPGCSSSVEVLGAATLRLSAGHYSVGEVLVHDGGRVEATGAVSVNVWGSIILGEQAYLGVQPGSGLTAADARLQAFGNNGWTQEPAQTTAGAILGTGSTVRAIVMALAGTVRIGSGSTATGAFIGRDVHVASGATVTLEGSAAPPADCTPGCNDSNPCTEDSCVNGVCAYAPVSNGAACDDDDACSTTDVCENGACVAAATVTCVPSTSCHEPGVCDPAWGGCSLIPKPDGTTCDDGLTCTQGDACNGGWCSGEWQWCGASDQCHDAGWCEESTGQCPTIPAPNGRWCSDGNACTQTDSCQSGTCLGENPVRCTADSCHETSACNPETGHCSDDHKPDGVACNDGRSCTQGETCQEGTCSGQPICDEWILDDFAVFAQRSARIETDALINDGDVAVLGPAVSGYPASDQLLYFGPGSEARPWRALIAPSVFLESATAGHVHAVTLSALGSTHGSWTRQVPSLPALPVLLPVVPGSTPLIVPEQEWVNLSAGRWSTVQIGAGANVRLRGGVYEALDFTVEDGARLEVLNPGGAARRSQADVQEQHVHQADRYLSKP